MGEQSVSAKILVVEDEASMREMLEVALKKSGYSITMVANLKDALAKIQSGLYDLVITDIKLPDGSGLDLIARSKTLPEKPPILLMTAFGSTDMAVEAMKLGAFHYLTKPFKLEELHLLINRALADSALVKENATLKKEMQMPYSVDCMIGKSKSLKQLFSLIERVAETKTNILITGESGTGKELVARAIHYGGPLRSKPFVTINCGAIPENLMESEMFGHKRGSFTGAVVDKEGLFQVADGGTIFLDEVGELPLTIQVKLLRVLQDKSFRPVGGTDNLNVDVRIISATNRNLEDMVAKGEFREDLFYRLNVINIQTPPLRERKEDIPLLVEHFLRKYALGMGKTVKSISQAAMDILKNYEYPGNIRELQNIMERAVALEGRTEISVDSLPPTVKRAMTHTSSKAQDANAVTEVPGAVARSNVASGSVSGAPALEDSPFEQGCIDLEAKVADFERHYIEKALEKTGGVKKDAAKLLGLTFRSFRYRIAKYKMGDHDGDDLKDE
jgi:two-component system response regulator PilR (NtrC family)